MTYKFILGLRGYLQGIRVKFADEGRRFKASHSSKITQNSLFPQCKTACNWQQLRFCRRYRREIFIYTLIRYKSRLRKCERKTKRQKYYVQGQTERDLGMHQTQKQTIANTQHRKSYSHVYKLNSCLSSHTGTVYTQTVNQENVWTLSHDYNIQ